MIPLPCNPDAISIGYWLREGRQVTPITQLIPKDELLAVAPNTVSFEKYPELKQRLFELMSLSATGEQTKGTLGNLLCCLPQVEMPTQLGYDKAFRVLIVQFLDRFNFCISAVKRSCIHFLTPDRQDYSVPHLQPVLSRWLGRAAADAQWLSKDPRRHASLGGASP
jgi:tetraether lipid synthase